MEKRKETVRIYETRHWEWTCTECKEKYIILLDPTHASKVTCKNCNAEFKPDGGW